MLAQIAWLICIFVIAGMAYVWWQSQEIKELAKLAAKKQCDELALQYLDDSIVLTKISPHHLFKGRPCLRRRYTFEFSSTGGERYQGWVTTLGRRITDVELETHRIH